MRREGGKVRSRGGLRVDRRAVQRALKIDEVPKAIENIAKPPQVDYVVKMPRVKYVAKCGKLWNWVIEAGGTQM